MSEQKKFIFEIIILVSVVLFVRFYVFQLFHISGPSMCDTLNVINDKCQEPDESGEFVFVNEAIYSFFKSPERGEIVVFVPPNDTSKWIKTKYIKRVIGVPGDHIRIKDGRVYFVNGSSEQLVVEPYLNQGNQNQTQSAIQDFMVPEGYFFVSGDNRMRSLDSRFCFSKRRICDSVEQAFVPESQILGRAEFIIWPFWQRIKDDRPLQLKHIDPLTTTQNALKQDQQ